MGTGVRIATASVRTGFAMTWFFARGAVRGQRRGEDSPPYGGLQEVRRGGRADVGIGPYGGLTRKCLRGIPQSRLRRASPL